MKSKRKAFRPSGNPGTRMVMHDAAVAEPPSTSINVRAAKDQLSSLLERAARGNEVIITSDGEPKARLVPVRSQRKPFRMDWAWLRSQPVSTAPPAEQLIRADRNGRP